MYVYYPVGTVSVRGSSYCVNSEEYATGTTSTTLLCCSLLCLVSSRVVAEVELSDTGRDLEEVARKVVDTVWTGMDDGIEGHLTMVPAASIGAPQYQEIYSTQASLAYHQMVADNVSNGEHRRQRDLCPSAESRICLFLYPTSCNSFFLSHWPLLSLHQTR